MNSQVVVDQFSCVANMKPYRKPYATVLIIIQNKARIYKILKNEVAKD